MSDRRGLGRLQIGVIGREGVAGRARVSRESRSLVGERVMQLAHCGSRSQSEPDAKGLTTRAARAEPSRRRRADPPLELGLAGIEGIAEGGVPRKLISRDRVQLEQSSHERSRLLAREVSSLDQSNRVRKIRERQTACKTWTVRALGGVGRGDQLPRSTAAQAPATAEFIRLRHGTETRELDSNTWGRRTLRPVDRHDLDRR